MFARHVRTCLLVQRSAWSRGAGLLHWPCIAAAGRMRLPSRIRSGVPSALTHHQPLAAGHVDKSLYTSVQVEPSETFVSYVNSAGGPQMPPPLRGAWGACPAAQRRAAVLETRQVPARDPAPTAPLLLTSSLTCADEVTDVTINLKDFKAMLGLCENLGAQVMLLGVHARLGRSIWPLFCACAGTWGVGY